MDFFVRIRSYRVVITKRDRDWVVLINRRCADKRKCFISAPIEGKTLYEALENAISFARKRHDDVTLTVDAVLRALAREGYDYLVRGE